MIIRSKAPYRISFGGGGSDVPPYCWEHGGQVTSTTVDKYAYATLRPGDETITIRSIDFDLTRSFDVDTLKYSDDDLDLVKAVINQFEFERGFELTVHTDLPAGSGMGGSASVAVALVGVLSEFVDRDISAKETADLAYVAEREDLGIKGGYQDQFAAAFGGLNTIEFYAEDTTVTPVDVSSGLKNELQYRSLLYYTGETRDSGDIHEDMEKQYEQEETSEKARRDRLKDVADRMYQALEEGNLAEFGALLHEGWEYKKRMSDKISNLKINEIYETARRNGAVGGKILGAGGGGHLLFFVRPDAVFDVEHALEPYALERVPFHFESNGLQTWVSNE